MADNRRNQARKLLRVLRNLVITVVGIAALFAYSVLEIRIAVVHNILVIGPNTFITQTQKAFWYLERCSPKAVGTIDESISVIVVSGNAYGIYANWRVFLATMDSAFGPTYSESEQLLWYMGALAHEGYHGWQYRNGYYTTWDELNLSEREALEKGPLGFQIETIRQCYDDVPGSTYLEAQGLTKPLEDIRNGVVPCGYCMEGLKEQSK